MQRPLILGFRLSIPVVRTNRRTRNNRPEKVEDHYDDYFYKVQFDHARPVIMQEVRPALINEIFLLILANLSDTLNV